MTMHVDFEPHYTIKLTGPELRVIGLALAGRLKDSTDLEQARVLNSYILKARESRLSEALAIAQAAIKNTENKP